MEMPFDKSALSGLDQSSRAMTDRSYGLCLHRCMEDRDGEMAACKKACFTSIQVNFRHLTHVAKDNEENAYRKCLANSASFPAVSQEDFMKCSNGIFADRVEIMTNQVASEATKIFNISRS